MQTAAQTLTPMRFNVQALAAVLGEDVAVLMPAYGRRYDCVEDMMESWEAGFDFKIYNTGSYCSVRDREALQETYSVVHLTQASPFLTIRIV